MNFTVVPLTIQPLVARPLYQSTHIHVTVNAQLDVRESCYIHPSVPRNSGIIGNGIVKMVVVVLGMAVIVWDVARSVVPGTERRVSDDCQRQ